MAKTNFPTLSAQQIAAMSTEEFDALQEQTIAENLKPANRKAYFAMLADKNKNFHSGRVKKYDPYADLAEAYQAETRRCPVREKLPSEGMSIFTPMLPRPAR